MKEALVVGKGKSGKSAKEFLEKIGYNVEAIDSAEFEMKKDRLKNLSFICVSPGVDVKKLNVSGMQIQGEMELGFDFIPCDTIAITGTNGKTTTTTLVGDMCKKQIRTFVGGNIGVPVTSFCLNIERSNLCVLEVSSFQAETFSHFRPHIGAFLNFKEDHLNRHGTMEEYFNAKMNVFKNQTKADFAVFNFDDERLRNIADNVNSQVYFFSIKNKVKGCYLKNNYIYFNNATQQSKLFRMPDNVIGDHNKQNVLAAVLIAKLAGIRDEYILETINEFKLAENRLEIVSTINGISFINDSKSTNIASTEAAVNSFKENIVLILGGSDKGYSFDLLFKNLPKNVKNIVAMGETADKIVESANRFKFKKICRAENLLSAVKISFNLAKRKELILLSPACASFDMFSSYEERGREFKRLVRELKNEICKNDDKQKTRF